MPCYKPYDYHQMVIIPLSLESQLRPGTPEYAIHHLIEERMDRFTLLGWLKVNIQWLLYCLVHNIEKILNFGNSYAMATA